MQHFHRKVAVPEEALPFGGRGDGASFAKAKSDLQPTSARGDAGLLDWRGEDWEREYRRISALQAAAAGPAAGGYGGGRMARDSRFTRYMRDGARTTRA